MQKNKFSPKDADDWHLRNKNMNPINESILQLITDNISKEFKVDSILEIGCSDGKNLEYLSRKYDCKGVGVDISPIAINSGNMRLDSSGYDKCSLMVADATSIGYETNSFDIVIAGFFLYLIDRDQVYKTISEIDRLLRNNGFLVIIDFDHTHKIKNTYSHNKNLFSFKSLYENIFLASGHYHLTFKKSFSHSSLTYSVDPQERITLTILFKEIDSYLSI